MHAPENLRPNASGPAIALLAGALCVLLSACSKPAPKTEDVRPVRVMSLATSDIGIHSEFPGEVRPRVESRLAFRVGGKITARKVDVGTLVKRGQLLMQLDPQDLQLAQAQALASLRAAETARDLARAELKRYQDLRAQNFVSQAVLDAKVSAARSAQATVDSAQAAYRGQSNQAGYTSLVADVDGVVTAVDAEVGQVVMPGAPVVRVAKAGDKEVVIGIPEDQVEVMRKVAGVTVRLWANPKLAIPGKIREIAPVADPLTRTYAVKVAIPDSAAEARLGMTALVQFSSRTPAPMISVPLTALYHDHASTSVWVVEHDAVRLVPVKVGGITGNDIILVDGVAPGQTVVTAGVNLLRNGQKVKILPTVAALPEVPAAVLPSAEVAR